MTIIRPYTLTHPRKSGGGGGAPALSATWNPADTAGAGTTLSNSNKTFAPNTTGTQGARAASNQSSGKLVFEITIGASGNVGSSQSGYGLSNAGASFGNLFVASQCVIALQNANYNYNATGNQANAAPTCTNGATLMFAVDMTNHLWWLMSSANPGQWNTNTSGSANPATGTGGLAWSGLNAALFPVGFVNSGTGSDASYTINTVAPFVNPVPAGFSAWGGGGVGATTTWNPADKGAHITLSANNLLATMAAGSAGDEGVRSTTSKSSGKWVYEMGYNFPGGAVSDTGCGIANGSATFPGLGGNGNLGAMLFMGASGPLYVNTFHYGSPVNSNWTSAAMTTMWALDVGNNKLWFATSNNGLWNNDVLANQNPATNTGGINLTTPAGVTGPYYAACVITAGNTGQAFSVNFGQSAFVNAVPSGFSAWG